MNEAEEEAAKVQVTEGEGDSQKQEGHLTDSCFDDCIDWEASKGCTDISNETESTIGQGCRINQAVGVER